MQISSLFKKIGWGNTEECDLAAEELLKLQNMPKLVSFNP